MITSLEVTLESVPTAAYPIWIGPGLLAKSCSWMPKNCSTVVVITDDNVAKRYASTIEQTLKKQGYNTLLLSFPAGEQSKNRYIKSSLEDKMLEHGCDRDSLILAIGGGVVGDLAGFIAATYMRGIAYIQVPTTLLAMLDSSVGGKTGIDTPQGKNLIGAFWQPIAVIADTLCLKTLGQEQIINGLIEALKMFLTSDADSWHDLQQNLTLILSGDQTVLSEMVRRAVQIKVNIVKNDARECHQRAVLNFGHTIGHALEQLSDYQLLHGYAVALGILLESKIAQLIGLLEPEHVLLIRTLLSRLNITSHELKKFEVDAVIQCTKLDKKNRANEVHYVLLNDIGAVYEIAGQFTHPVADELVKRAILELIED